MTFLVRISQSLMYPSELLVRMSVWLGLIDSLRTMLLCPFISVFGFGARKSSMWKFYVCDTFEPNATAARLSW